jgi:hypothetical protein
MHTRRQRGSLEAEAGACAFLPAEAGEVLDGPPAHAALCTAARVEVPALAGPTGAVVFKVNFTGLTQNSQGDPEG